MNEFNLSEVAQWRERDLTSVRESDVVVMIYPEHEMLMTGACVEVGYAMALNKPIYALGRVPKSAMLSTVIRVSCLTELGRLLNILERKRVIEDE